MNMLLQIAQSSSNYGYITNSNSEIVGPAAVGIALLISIVVSLVVYILVGLFLGPIFKKAGIAGWTAWVPFYNQWKLLEMGGQYGFWAIISIIPYVGFISVVFLCIATYHVGLKFGKSGTFVLLAIFLPIVWLAWLAVDKSTWNNALGAPSKASEHNSPTPTATV